MVQELNERLREKELKVELSEKAINFISQEAYEPAFGARPLKRYLQKNVETLLAKKILGGDVGMGDVLCIDESEGRLYIR